MMAESENNRSEHKCAFCRQPAATVVDGKYIKHLRKLIKRNHPFGLMQIGYLYRVGNGVMQSDTKSLDMFIRAAELGVAQAFIMIGSIYEEGNAVTCDRSKSLECHKVAAKKGRIIAHNHLALFYERSGDIQISIKHLKVAACAGHQEAMDQLMKHYKNNLLPKEDLAQTLRAYQASSDLMKSTERDEAQLVLRASRHT